MTQAELCNDAEVHTLVHDFYDQVRIDPVLGPIFNRHITDWDHHLEQLVNFWSSILRGTGRFSGSPMPKHIALPDLSAELFQYWLALFHTTTLSQPNQAMGEKAYSMAQRIAQSLWYGYQMGNKPDEMPKTLSGT